MRPVLDLSILNQYLVVPHFKMETNRSIRTSIHVGIWTTSLDLTDAYFHVPIAPPFRKFLRLALDGKVYAFRAVPFGLSTASTPGFHQHFSSSGGCHSNTSQIITSSSVVVSER
jgi:hypothetical protein